MAFCAPWFNITRDNADSAGMLAHLHAYFIDADLLYDNEFRALGVTPTFAFVTGEGVVSNHWPSGATWLQAPGYAMGLLTSRTLAWFGVGKSSVYGVVPLLAVRGWAMLVLLLMGRAVARLWDPPPGSPSRGPTVGAGAGTVAAVAFTAGTPLLYYASEAPLRPHLWGCAVLLVVVLLWHRQEVGTATTRAVVLGSLVGLATCVRPQLAVAWVLVAEDAWGSAPGRGRRLALAAGAAAVWPLVHLRTQVWMYGGSLGDYGGEVSHHVRAFLLSPYHGAVVWSPVLVLGAAALVLAIVRRQRGAWLLGALVLHQCWLDSGMRDITPYSVLGTRTWSGGVGFGARKLVDVLPLFLPAMHALSEEARARGWGRPLAAAVLAACVPSVALHAAAFVDPSTTSALLDWRGLEVVLSRPWSTARWGAAASVRAVPFAVTLGVGLATGALALAAVRVRAVLPSASNQRWLISLGTVVIGAGVAAHLWLTALMVRSDTALFDDPQRMAEARAGMHPAHEAAVARIPAHHATLRAVLGGHAAPPE